MSRTRSHYIAPSILAADFKNLRSEIQMINESDADWCHLDVMDGRFVPNISFGLPIVKAVKELSERPLDVHLMIVEPDLYIEAFRNAGADIITVHIEACNNLHRTISQIKELGAQAGVAVNPHTSIDLLDDILEDVNLICLMSVNPGFGGQKFIYRTLAKIKSLRAKLDERNLDAYIEVDGGVGMQNAESILGSGADVLVAGSSIFASDQPKETIKHMKALNLSLKWV